MLETVPTILKYEVESYQFTQMTEWNPYKLEVVLPNDASYFVYSFLRNKTYVHTLADRFLQFLWLQDKNNIRLYALHGKHWIKTFH